MVLPGQHSNFVGKAASEERVREGSTLHEGDCNEDIKRFLEDVKLLYRDHFEHRVRQIVRLSALCV